MVVKQPECYVKFKDAWLSEWSPAILKQTKSKQTKSRLTMRMIRKEWMGNILLDIYYTTVTYIV